MKVVLRPREDWFACTRTAQWVIGAAASHHRMNNSARRGHSTDGNGGTNGGGSGQQSHTVELFEEGRQTAW